MHSYAPLGLLCKPHRRELLQLGALHRLRVCSLPDATAAVDRLNAPALTAHAGMWGWFGKLAAGAYCRLDGLLIIVSCDRGTCNSSSAAPKQN